MRAGVLMGTGMGGLTVFSDGVQNLIEKGYRKISPFFIPYAMDVGFMGPNYSISNALPPTIAFMLLQTTYDVVRLI